jgi:hypothetical protein
MLRRVETLVGQTRLISSPTPPDWVLMRHRTVRRSVRRAWWRQDAADWRPLGSCRSRISEFVGKSPRALFQAQTGSSCAACARVESACRPVSRWDSLVSAFRPQGLRDSRMTSQPSTSRTQITKSRTCNLERHSDRHIALMRRPPGGSVNEYWHCSRRVPTRLP